MITQMIVGIEWLIEAKGCNKNLLRNEDILRRIFDCVIDDLDLKTLGRDVWHKFEGNAGVTGITALTESHLACHTYPEYETATFNLYCCKTRPEWDWKKYLIEMLEAKDVSVTRFERISKYDTSVSDKEDA